MKNNEQQPKIVLPALQHPNEMVLVLRVDGRNELPEGWLAYRDIPTRAHLDVFDNQFDRQHASLASKEV